MADIFDVVADGTRRRLLRLLLDRSRGDGEVSVSELVTELELSQPTVSKHLKVLRDHGLVSVREEGQHRYYRLDAEPLAELEEWLAPFRGTRPVADRAAAGAREQAEDREGPASDAAGLAAGAEAGARAVGRAAADAAHSARLVVEAAQEKLQQAEARIQRLVDRIPFGND